MNWSLAELRRRLAANPDLSLERPLEAARRPRTRGRGESASTTYDAAQTLYDYIRIHAPDLYPMFIREYPFERFRIDLAIPSRLLAVEANGGRWLPGGGKHGTERDRHKIRRLTIAGWKVLEYSTELIDSDPLGVIAEIREVLQ